MRRRRDFIKTTSAAVLALGVAPAAWSAPGKIFGGLSAEERVLHCAQFAELLGAAFRVRANSGTVSSLVLVEAKDRTSQSQLQNAHSGFQHENFSLLFRAPLRRTLPQGTYQFYHRRLGTHPIFIVPVLNDGRNVYYEAVFNRIS
jgi:hypothetical protein